MTIIGISGKARSGKDTFAEMLAKELNKTSYPPYVMMAFANELKLKCQRDFDLSYEQLWGDSKEELDKRYIKYETQVDMEPVVIYWTAREIMQNYGAFYRTIDRQFWVKNLFKVIEEKEYKNVIITDVRYTNEADYILEQGGIVIRVERENKDAVHNDTHPSEVELDDYKKFTFTVVNNFTLEVLEKTAAETVSLLKEFNKLKESN
jgi:adenosyl cobinamide kinase/adenosyl cobinamide phosphate guanylyltransferase